MAVYGTGTLIKRGRIWYYSYYDNGRNRMESSHSEKKADAIKLRDRIMKQKMAGTLPDHGAGKVLCGELLDDVLAHVKTTGKESTAKVWSWVIERKETGLRAFFGNLRASAVTTERLKDYRSGRIAEGRTDATANRELSILRTAFHLGRKTTPPKIQAVPYFPMTNESGNVRQGFLADAQYEALRDAIEDFGLKALFVTAFHTGIRKGELLAIRVSQLDLESGFLTLYGDATKSGESRLVPIFDGDMKTWLTEAAKDKGGEEFLFTWTDGSPIKDFRGSWDAACEKAGVPDLHFHDLRRTACMALRRAGVPQYVRMKIMGHKTPSMEQRYSIIDTEDFEIAKTLMAKKSKPEQNA